MNKATIFFLLFGLLYSCKQKDSSTSTEKIEEIDTQQFSKGNTSIAQYDTLVHEQTIEVDSGQWNLSLLTHFYNQRIDSPAVVFNEPIRKQELIFTGRLFRLVSLFKTGATEVRMVTGVNSNVQVVSVYEISVITGKRGWFYKVSAASNFMPQIEDYSAFSSNGELLWNSNSITNEMATKLKNRPRYFGLVKLLDHYGVNFENFNHPKITASTNIVVK